MEKSKKIDLVNHYYNQKKFKEQSIENQRFDLLEQTSALFYYASQVIKDCKNLENKIDTIRDCKLLKSHIVSSLDLFDLSLNVSNLEKTFARLNGFMDIYLANKKDEQ